MQISRIVAVALVFAVTSTALPAQTQPWNNRKMSVTATISGSRGLYDGTFTASNVANTCGEVGAMYNFSGQASFIIEYPRDPQETDQVQSVGFGSTKLVGKATSTPSFLLNISVLAKNGGRPYPYALNTQDNPNVKGLATLVRNKNKSVTLTVRGTNEARESIVLMITCM